MDKIEKALNKLSKKEQKAVKKILETIKTGRLQNLDVKKLKARHDIFRVRRGDIRVIYRKGGADNIFILAIERRSEKTYKRF